jgi:outer membrane protein TolC
MQRDVRFEPLVQSERDVVYAARDFVQFRKRLFRDLANDYYSLLLSYRQIAIDTQDYFSNLDGFNRAAALYQAGRIPSFQVDQFEQNVLESRRSLVTSCNTVERLLDQLKVTIGLPPEMPLNLALDELEALTQADESTAIREQIRRTREKVRQQIASRESSVAIPLATELARRMLRLHEVLAELGEADTASGREIEILIALLEAEEKRIEAAENAVALDTEIGEGPLPLQIFLRNDAVLETTLEAIQRELKLLELLSTPLDRQSSATDAGDDVSERDALPPPARDQELRQRDGSRGLEGSEADFGQRELASEQLAARVCPT